MKFPLAGWIGLEKSLTGCKINAKKLLVTTRKESYRCVNIVGKIAN